MSETTVNQPQPQPKFNPLEEKVNEKSYAQGANAIFSQAELEGDLGEPSFMPPPADIMDIPSAEDDRGSSKQKEQKPEKPKPFNPSMADVPEGEKFERAKQMGDNLMLMFKKVHEMGNELLKISDKKIRKKIQAGEVDMEMAVPFEVGSEVTFREFVVAYNEQCNDVHKVTPEFEKALMPSVYAELAKHGHGMSNMQNIIFLLTQHTLQQGFKHVQMRQMTNSVFEFAKDMKEMEAENRRQRPAAVPNYQPAAPIVTDDARQPEPAHQAPVVHMNEPVTLQDKALDNYYSQLNTGAPAAAMPEYGNAKTINGINKIISKDIKDQDRARKSINRINAARKEVAKKHDAPPDGTKKKRGPKIGSKRKPKN